MIRDYLQLNYSSTAFSTTKDPYADSKATLYGDIHRVRRYFHFVTKTLDHIPYLDRQAVDLSIKEIRRTYDDDGNVLSNIHGYLRTFCMKNTVFSAHENEQQRVKWIKELKEKQQAANELREKLPVCDKKCQELQKSIEVLQLRRENFNIQIKDLAKSLNVASIQKLASLRTGKAEVENDMKKKEELLAKHDLLYMKTSGELIEYEARIKDLEGFLKLDLADEQRKLKVKFGRGLLLYGPPGTGKSELLKRAAVFAGITTTTTPLAAGELNRPHVGETEKLLVDIMYRSNPISYLICAMIIDEIDGLVPKRDNNAQQSKVDGISVLLSHIEGVKNIPNLIVLGATNRRNMMDEAFLRRMQAKCFVGRPSPKIREKMLQPLIVKDPHTFTRHRIDFLVKITTNFSGAAVGALKSSIIVALDQGQTLNRDVQTSLQTSQFQTSSPDLQSTSAIVIPSVEAGALSKYELLTLADGAAREFSCWFGIGTLPGIFRLYPNMCSSSDQERYSLALPNHVPSGRILVNLSEKKCIIEVAGDDLSLEHELDEQETCTLALLSRFINGCSSRNIDTIQIIDLNFLTKNNAFEENQIFELLTTTFLGKY
ncbi:unnamed protein product [Rotaria sp. Silwood2]|nr:unnamed protein product [Rotaria sp. Silwood2]CAF3110793.1 unnamed protein product [Rotaria sp. Silwood2]CAF3424167.1 unnamed protein product [Rotaria sp. Silwood2]CAF4377132.1 unnamed protein product [Rotaria sp. Silwood2]CAF4456962.1 unnamed protein product [Rotaria sp. Silwood2]